MIELSEMNEFSREIRLSDSDPFDDGVDGDVISDVKVQPAKPKVKPPPLYKVIMFNDPYTRMEFVVHVLQKFFGMDYEKAYRVMMTVHMTDQAVVGIYPFEIAESKSVQVNEYSQQHDFPLLTTIEETDSD